MPQRRPPVEIQSRLYGGCFRYSVQVTSQSAALQVRLLMLVLQPDFQGLGSAQPCVSVEVFHFSAVVSTLNFIQLTFFDFSLQKLEANLRARATLIFRSVISLLVVAFCVRFCATIAYYGKNSISNDTVSADFAPCSYQF
jgi:hypothetical protein